jgi:hypothetical protein
MLARIKIKYPLLVLIILLNIKSAGQQSAIRLAVYNLKQYSNVNKASNEIKKIINTIKPTILLAVELDGSSAVKDLLNNALSAKYKASTELTIKWGTGNECAVFYIDSLVNYLGSSMYSADPRPIAEFKFTVKDFKDTLHIFGVHLKAYPEETARRLTAVNVLRGRTQIYGNKKNMVVAGDFNIFTSEEPAFKKLTDQSTAGYFVDMTNATGSFSENPELASTYTYSPNDLDTRLDMILISPSLITKGGIDYLDNSFKIFGNDTGKHYNTSITDTSRGINSWFASDPSIGTALTQASDHLPIYADFQFGVPTEISSENNLPALFELKQNYPNPFNPSTVISYRLAVGSQVNLKVYDVLGREVTTLVDEFKPAGSYKIRFNVKTESTPFLTTGIYFYKITAGSFSSVRKMLLVK